MTALFFNNQKVKSNDKKLCTVNELKPIHIIPEGLQRFIEWKRTIACMAAILWGG